MDEIKENHKSKLGHQGEVQSRIFRRIMSASFLKPYSCVGVLYVLGEWTGFGTIISYAKTILRESGSSIDPGIGLIILGGFRLMAAGMNYVYIIET